MTRFGLSPFKRLYAGLLVLALASCSLMSFGPYTSTQAAQVLQVYTPTYPWFIGDVETIEWEYDPNAPGPDPLVSGGFLSLYQVDGNPDNLTYVQDVGPVNLSDTSLNWTVNDTLSPARDYTLQFNYTNSTNTTNLYTAPFTIRYHHRRWWADDNGTDGSSGSGGNGSGNGSTPAMYVQDDFNAGSSAKNSTDGGDSTNHSSSSSKTTGTTNRTPSSVHSGASSDDVVVTRVLGAGAMTMAAAAALWL